MLVEDEAAGDDGAELYVGRSTLPAWCVRRECASAVPQQILLLDLLRPGDGSDEQRWRGPSSSSAFRSRGRGTDKCFSADLLEPEGETVLRVV